MTQRNEVVDFIRGFAILSVILVHCKIHLPINQSLLSITWVKWLLISGYYGVMIFFVVSGFLITSNCIRKWNELQSININQFYVMRFARIMPCLIALLVILSVLHWMTIKGFVIQNASLEQAWFSAITFHINWLEAKVGYLPANWNVLWSLSIEEVFYLFFPLLCILMRKEKHITMILFIFILVGPLARTRWTGNDIWSDHSYLSCMDGIAIGCLAAIFAAKNRFKNSWLFVIGCLLFGFIFFFRKQALDLGITPLGLNVTFLEMGIACILIATQHTHFKLFKSIRWFGRNSYEIYLTHSFIVLFAASVFYRSNQTTRLIALEYLIIIVCSGILGQIIATYYSEPLNRYIRKRVKEEKLATSPLSLE